MLRKLANNDRGACDLVLDLSIAMTSVRINAVIESDHTVTDRMKTRTKAV